MTAGHILTLLALVFLLAAVVRLARGGFRIDPASRTWLLVGLIFGGVASWLWWRAP